MNESTDKSQAEREKLSTMLASRGIPPETWHVLCNSVFPGAESRSILLAVDYCKARGLDVLKKPCHIVPMYVNVVYRGQDGSRQERSEWRDVILPGIYEYRTTAHRTGEYHGHSEPRYGELVDFRGIQVPAWCAMRGYRVNRVTNEKAAYPVKLWFSEVAATKKDGALNARWSRSPIQMLTKCTEAAMLREMFPEELGGEPTVEEMEGRTIEVNEDGEISEISGKRTSKKPATRAPKALGKQDNPLAWINAKQLELLRESIEAQGIPEKEFTRKFEINEVTELPVARFQEALKWVSSVNAPPEDAP